MEAGEAGSLLWEEIPKASRAREALSETKIKENQGAQSPLSGEPSVPGSSLEPSKDPGPISEECGRSWRGKKQKRTTKVLERWPFDLGPKSLGPQKGRQIKRLEGTTLGKRGRKTDKSLEKQALALEDWLEISTGGTSVPRKEPEKKNQ